MHKTFISYHHKNEQDLKDEIIDKGSKENFIDKSVKDGDIDPYLTEETIMSKIREDFIGDSTVVVVLVGEETANRPYINSEIQAALWGNPTGLIGVVRDDLFDRIYYSTTCTHFECNCGISLISQGAEYDTKVPYLVKENNTRLENGKSTNPHYSDTEAYCGIYKYSYFIDNMEKCIDEAFEKRSKEFNIKKANKDGVPTIKKSYSY